MLGWNDKAKRLLKSDLIKRGVSVIGCEKLEIESYESELFIAAEPQTKYNVNK